MVKMFGIRIACRVARPNASRGRARQINISMADNLDFAWINLQVTAVGIGVEIGSHEHPRHV